MRTTKSCPPCIQQPMGLRCCCCCTILHVCVAVTCALMFLTGRVRGRYGPALLGQPCGQRKTDGREAASFGAPAYSPKHRTPVTDDALSRTPFVRCQPAVLVLGRRTEVPEVHAAPACLHHSTVDCLLCRPDSSLHLLLVAPIMNSGTSSRAAGAFLTCQKQSIEGSLPHSCVL